MISHWIQERIEPWYAIHRRPFPWRATTEPYLVLIAEVLLRRTSYAKALPAYRHLIAVAPTPGALAKVPIAELQAVVRPLGLMNRATQLQRLGQTIVERHQGQIPQDASDLQALPGVGRYIASAVRCFAFGLSDPLVDGLTGRFYRRFLGLASGMPPADDHSLWDAVAEIQPPHPRDFHLAAIDLSSTVCRLRRPRCGVCPLAELCSFNRTETVAVPE